MILQSTAYHLGSSISIASAIKDLDFDLAKTEQEFALFELAENSWIYIKNYGSVVFINVDDQLKSKILASLNDASFDIESLPYEDFDIDIEAGNEIQINYGLIRLPNISIDIAHVIALNLAQSVALDHFHKEVEQLIEITSEYSLVLSKKGNMIASQKDINRISGRTMILKNKIAEHLYIFQSPDVVWDEADLSKVDEQMRKDLEIDKRHHGIQLHLDIVKENLDNYMNILQHKHSSMLEWIIILLIFIEIIHVFFV